MPSSLCYASSFLLPLTCATPTAVRYSTEVTTRPTAVLDSGSIAGIATLLPSSTSTVNKFLGVPFAAPPVRFDPPQFPQSWEHQYDASSYKPACIQKSNDSELINEPNHEGESEDCLYLNVFAPSQEVEESKKGKAVLFWIFGGGFQSGAGSLKQYDGSWLANKQNVVVVTFNYRTNVFGFPQAPDIPETKRNLGLLDQRLALDWVKRNIAAFGGDPDKVTIFGESAGAGSVDMLITAPPDSLPFRAAIMQSGQQSIVTPTAPGDGKDPWEKLVKLVNCSTSDSLTCVRALPAPQLRDIVAENSLNFANVPDGLTYSKSPREDRLKSTEEPRIARVPVMIGSNGNEGSIYAAIGQNDTEAFLRSNLPGVTDEVIETLLSAYPIGSPLISNEIDRVDQIITELLAACPISIYTNDAASVDIPTWRYYFNASFPNSELFPNSGAFHSAEIQMVFGTYEKKNSTAWQKETSDAMMKAWADFAKDPENGPGWEGVERGKVGVFGGGVRVSDWHWNTKVLETIPSKALDQRCELYKDLLEV